MLAVGLAQITGTPSGADENRSHSLDAARQLFDEGAELVVLPELIVPGYEIDRDYLEELAEPVDGPTVQAWTGAAARADAYLAGGFCERSGSAIYNSAVIVGRDGILLHYRKLHLFGAEKHVFMPGDLGLPIADLSFGRVGLCICYDLRFVETARILALRGVELICVPTAWVAGFDTERHDAEGYCPQARGALLQANLDQVYIACASQAQTCRDNQFLGSSVLCDPYGRALIGPLGHDRQELAVERVDLDTASRAQTRSGGVAPGADRRPDVYRLEIGDERL